VSYLVRYDTNNIYLEELKTTRKIRQNSRSPGRDSNPEHSEYGGLPSDDSDFRYDVHRWMQTQTRQREWQVEDLVHNEPTVIAKENLV